jgi:DeoR/GlpR family transcriptional regulator of sugar metabolism
MTTDIPLARRDQILQRLEQGLPVVANSLAAEFNVSEDAIRRDLRALAADGLCRRVYGGALPVHSSSKPMAARVGEDWPRKEALARVAAKTIQAHEFIFLDAGSTNLAMVDHLPEDKGLTVATNSIDIAMAVKSRGDLELIMVGGAVDAEVGGCIDASAIQAVAAMNIDRCFLGACALSAKSGLGAIHHGDALFKRAVLTVSQTCIVMVSNEKLSAKAPHRIAQAKVLNQVILEEDAPTDVLAELRRSGVAFLLAKVST